MANYINSSIPIFGYQKAIKELEQDLYGGIEVDTRLLDEVEESNYDKELLIALLIAYLLRKSPYSGVGYLAILDAISNTHIRNYKGYFTKNGIYNKNSDWQIRQEWSQERKNIEELLQSDLTINRKYHTENAVNIRDSAFYRLARTASNIYVAKKSIDVIQSALASKSNRYQSILGAVGGTVPNEIQRISEVIRRGKVLDVSEVIGENRTLKQVVRGSDRWRWHQWVAYTRTDYPCYGTDGEVVEVGDTFSNGLYAPKVHRGCYCITTPVFKN